MTDHSSGTYVPAQLLAAAASCARCSFYPACPAAKLTWVLRLHVDVEAEARARCICTHDAYGHSAGAACNSVEPPQKWKLRSACAPSTFWVERRQALWAELHITTEASPGRSLGADQRVSTKALLAFPQDLI